MSDYDFKEYDFEHPSILFVLEDILKGLIGGPLLYNPYFKTFGLKGNERVLDFGCGAEPVHDVLQISLVKMDI